MKAGFSNASIVRTGEGGTRAFPGARPQAPSGHADHTAEPRP
jgi:hypothetical protein